jgi:hypothetical protein
MEFFKTSVDLFGLKIMEPVTVVTDLLVTAVCLYAFFKIKVEKRSLMSLRLLKYFFLTMSLATAYGGIIGHAFQDYLSFGWKLPGWLISMTAIALMERSAILHAQHMLPNRIGKFFSALNILELVSLIVIVLITLDFFFVEAHAAYGLMGIVLVFEGIVYLKTKDKGSLLILIAVAFATLAAVVHLSKFILHDWFNHLDLGHVLMAVSSYLFYLGAIKIKPTSVGLDSQQA